MVYAHGAEDGSEPRAGASKRSSEEAPGPTDLSGRSGMPGKVAPPVGDVAEIIAELEAQKAAALAT